MKSRGFAMNLRRLLCPFIIISVVSVCSMLISQPAFAETGGQGSIENDIITAEVRFDAHGCPKHGREVGPRRCWPRQAGAAVALTAGG